MKNTFKPVFEAVIELLLSAKKDGERVYVPKEKFDNLDNLSHDLIDYLKLKNKLHGPQS